MTKSIICHKCGQSTSIKHFFCPWCSVSLTIAESRTTVWRVRPCNKTSASAAQIAAIAKTCDRYAENCGLQSGMASAFNGIARQLRTL